MNNNADSPFCYFIGSPGDIADGIRVRYSIKVLINGLLIYQTMQVLKSVEIGALSVIMLIGIIALTTELIENEEIAKLIVIPSLILLIILTGYEMFRRSYRRN